MAECINDGLTWQKDRDFDDRPLFECLLELGANPDALFTQVPLPDSWPRHRTMSVREACLMTFQTDLLRRLPVRSVALATRYDSQLWWVLGVHAEEDNAHLWARLRDEGERWLPRIAATVEWVLDHEHAPAVHTAILRQAMKANTTWRATLAVYLDRLSSAASR